nr:hypothetical protein [Tanacetum cinerariifolium]
IRGSDSLPAAYLNALGINPLSLRGAEESYHGANIGGQAHAAHGREAGNVGVNLLIIAGAATAKVSFDGAGRHDVGPNAAAG